MYTVWLHGALGERNLRRSSCLGHRTTQGSATEAGRSVCCKARPTLPAKVREAQDPSASMPGVGGDFAEEFGVRGMRNKIGAAYLRHFEEDSDIGKMSDLGKKHVQRAANLIAHRS